MIDDQKYVISSLELHLFFSRLMKEHSIFLKAGFTAKDLQLANTAEHYKKEFEKLLLCAVSASNGIIRPDVLNSGEIITDFTLGIEDKTQALTGIEIDQNITRQESKLQSGQNPQVSSNLLNYVNQINMNAKMLINGLIKFKKRVLEGVLSCKLFTSNYPLFIDHLIREAELYFSLTDDLQNRVDIEARSPKQTELFMDEIMMEHALFIRGLLDPSEEDLIDKADEFANIFGELIEDTENTVEMATNSVTNQALDKTIQLKNFKEAGTDGIARCKIRSIIIPLIADHVLREANHYIRLLETYKENNE